MQQPGIVIWALSVLVAVSVPARADAQLPPRRFETTHEAVIAGHKLKYRAVVAEFFMKDPGGKRTASIIATSYVRSDTPKGAARPVLFVFNGGPGSASLWLDLGIAGPRRIDLPDPVHPPTTAPFHLTDNNESLLDVADVVLLDPPGTGFSRVLPDGKPEQFYGVAQDAEATVDFIEQWLRENDRWNSPKYLMGESYGTVRAAVVARLLGGGPTATGRMDGVALNGIILLGQALDMSGASGRDGRYLNELPTLAALACYHHRVATSCSADSQVAAANKLGADALLKALFVGSSLADSDRSAIGDSLASLIGLPRSVILDHDLRIGASDFAHLLLADQQQSLGAYDGRYVLSSRASGKDPVADDPAMAQYVPSFIAAYNDYAHGELRVTIDDAYQAIGFRDVNMRWDWGQGPGIGPRENYADDLAIAMRRNTHLRLLVGAGYYDLVTPLGEAAYLLAHSDIPARATEMHLYPAGHLVYLGDEPRKALSRDLHAFLSAR